MQKHMDGPHTAAALTESRRPDVQLEDKGLVASLTDCLSFSPAFTLTGFETVNDKLLKEMNERARLQLENKPQAQPRIAVPRTRPRLGGAALSDNAPRTVPSDGSRPCTTKTTSPPSRIAPNLATPSTNTIPQSTESSGTISLSTTTPSTVFPSKTNSRPLSASSRIAPGKQQNRQGSLGMRAPSRPIAPAGSPDQQSLPKRSGSGLESPSKRLRAPNGAPASPTTSLSQLSLSEKERLTQVSAARQQSRRENASPRRRQLHRTGDVPRGHMSLNARPLPSLKLEPSPSRAREPLGKQSELPRPQPRASNQAPRTIPRTTRSISQGHERQAPVPRSTSLRSVSATATNGVRPGVNENAGRRTGAPAAPDYDSLPSYARPTQATLRRSQSTVPHQQHGLSQHLRSSSSTRSVSRLLN